ncbi:MAG: lipocalin family protein [Winogradskyella sp.]|nr:lipocalin family protein [Winogradskyella sp.]
MKRLIIMLAAVCISQVYYSCSKDENQENIGVLLIGEWQPRQFVYNCEGIGENTVETGTFCDQDRLIFLANGTFSSISYDNEDNCSTSQSFSGNWAVAENDLFLVVDEDPSVAQIFRANSQILRLGDLLTDNPCDTNFDSQEPSFYYYEYQRVED